MNNISELTDHASKTLQRVMAKRGQRRLTIAIDVENYIDLKSLSAQLQKPMSEIVNDLLCKNIKSLKHKNTKA